MNPMNQGSLYKHPPAVGGYRFPGSMGGARLPHTAAPGKFPTPYEVPRAAAPSLYRCTTGRAVDIKKEGRETKEKVSIAILDQAFQILMKKDIKDSLTSFVSNIPGDFENQENPEGMLRSLIDRPPIGGREFLPISEHSLLGFRLHPGPLPEQYQLDPPTTSSEPAKHHKKKKKHKHKYHDRMEDLSLDNYSPIVSREQSPPVDPCEFIKREQTNNFFVPPPQPPPQPHLPFQAAPNLVPPSAQHHPHAIIQGIPAAMMVSPSGQIISTSFASSQSNVIVGAAGSKFPGSLPPHSQLQAYQIPGSSSATQVILNATTRIPAKPKKRKHENGEGGGAMKKKKKEKKEKRKKSKHHGLDQPPLPPAPPSSGPSSSHSMPPPLIHNNFPRPP